MRRLLTTIISTLAIGLTLASLYVAIAIMSMDIMSGAYKAMAAISLCVIMPIAIYVLIVFTNILDKNTKR